MVQRGSSYLLGLLLLDSGRIQFTVSSLDKNKDTNIEKNLIFVISVVSQYQQNVQSLQHAVLIRRHGLHMRFEAMHEDSYNSVPALTSFNRTLLMEHGRRYRTLIAQKTASLLWMLEDWIGSDKFHKALVKYVNLR